MLEDRLTQAADQLEKGWACLANAWNDRESRKVQEQYVEPLLAQAGTLASQAQELRLLMNLVMERMTEV